MRLTDKCPQCLQPWGGHRSLGEPIGQQPKGVCDRPRPALLTMIRPEWTLGQARLIGAVLTVTIDDIGDAGQTGDELREALAELKRAAGE